MSQAAENVFLPREMRLHIGFLYHMIMCSLFSSGDIGVKISTFAYYILQFLNILLKTERCFGYIYISHFCSDFYWANNTLGLYASH